MDSRWDFLSMKTSQRLWRSLLFVTLLAALCASSVLPLVNMAANAAPQMQATSCLGTTIAQWNFAGGVTTPSVGTGTLSYGTGVGAPNFQNGQTTAENPAI